MSPLYEEESNTFPYQLFDKFNFILTVSRYIITLSDFNKTTLRHTAMYFDED